MTSAELSGHREGAALVAYLSQATASASVCDPRAPGPHFGEVDEEVRSALQRGFRGGKIAPQLWRECVTAVLDGPDRTAASALVDDVLRAAVTAAEDGGLDYDAEAQARLDAIEKLYVERAPGLDARPGTIQDALSHLQRDVEGKRLGPIGQQRAADLLAALDLERAQWQGRPLDSAVLDALLQAGDERILRWAMNRLPEESLRTEARRRVVRLHLRASPFQEVRENSQFVEERVMRTGANPVAIVEHTPVRGWLDPSVASPRGVLVEQRIPEQSARLLGYTSKEPTPAVLPELPTRGALHVELAGLSLPVTVCAPPGDLDVTPCLAPGAIEVDGPLAVVDAGGSLHLTDSVTEEAVVTLARQGHRLVVPLVIAGRRMAELSWPLTFATPTDLVLAPAGDGAPGPDLDVHVDGLDPTRLLYSVAAATRVYQAVVEWPEAAAFHVVSRGAPGSQGMSGSDGSAGMDGTDGLDASCPGSSGSNGSAGGNGSNGGDGGPGGPGGRGGDVRVVVRATVPAREAILGVLETTVLSQGGPGGRGGSGGAGGRGGRGGRGGSGTSCTDSDGNTTSLSSGMSGMDGSDGMSGSDGASGAPGSSGRVTLVDGD